MGKSNISSAVGGSFWSKDC